MARIGDLHRWSLNWSLHRLVSFFTSRLVIKYFYVRSLSRPNTHMSIVNVESILDTITKMTYFNKWYVIATVQYIIKIDLKENSITIMTNWICSTLRIKQLLEMKQLLRILKVTTSWFLGISKVPTILFPKFLFQHPIKILICLFILCLRCFI